MSTTTLTPDKKHPSAANDQQLAGKDDAQKTENEKAAQKHVDHRSLKERKKGAYWAFHVTNFLGLHVLFNSTVSLFIAYNLLPTKPAQSAMEWMARVATPFNKFIGEITTPIKKMVQGSAFKQKTEQELAALAAHSARSRVETAFMCIAGFLALWPVKYLEDHRAGFMNTVDHWLHPGRSKEERKATDIKPEETPKETWTNLLRARFVGLGAVFAADFLQQKFNNTMTYEKGNIDTAAWKFGAWLSEKLPKGARSWLVGFFARHNVNLSGIQPDMRGHLLNTIKSPSELHEIHGKLGTLQEAMMKTADPTRIKLIKDKIHGVNTKFNETHPHLKPEIEKAIFAEQSRLLFTKEIFLTVLISTVIYMAAKAPFMARFFEKIGLKKKEPEQFNSSESVTSVADPATIVEAESEKQKIWSEREEKHDVKKEKMPAASFVESAVKSQAQEATVSLG